MSMENEEYIDIADGLSVGAMKIGNKYDDIKPKRMKTKKTIKERRCWSHVRDR